MKTMTNEEVINAFTALGFHIAIVYLGDYDENLGYGKCWSICFNYDGEEYRRLSMAVNGFNSDHPKMLNLYVSEDHRYIVLEPYVSSAYEKDHFKNAELFEITNCYYLYQLRKFMEYLKH